MCLGVIGSIVRTFDEAGVGLADVATDDGLRTACLLYCPDVRPGDDVLLHMGFVMEVIDPDRAAEARVLRRRLIEAETARRTDVDR